VFEQNQYQVLVHWLDRSRRCWCYWCWSSLSTSEHTISSSSRSLCNRLILSTDVQCLSSPVVSSRTAVVTFIFVSGVVSWKNWQFFDIRTANFQQNSDRQLRLNFRQRRLWMLKILILSQNFPKGKIFWSQILHNWRTFSDKQIFWLFPTAQNLWGDRAIAPASFTTPLIFVTLLNVLWLEPLEVIAPCLFCILTRRN